MSFIHFGAFIFVVTFYSLHWLEVNIATTLMAVFFTAFSSTLLVTIRDAYYKGELKIIGINYQKFENSIRIIVKVKNVGRTAVKYVKPLLIIDEEPLAQLVLPKRRNNDEHWVPCLSFKDKYTCPICAEDIRGFLCPKPFKVDGEYLCWTVADVDAGSGLFGKYYHVSNIPPNDIQHVVIADIYKDDSEGFSVVKFFSEYGTEEKPRICYKLSLGEKTSIPVTLRLVGEGSDPIEKKLLFEIVKDELKVILEDCESVSISEFREIKKFPRNYIPYIPFPLRKK